MKYRFTILILTFLTFALQGFAQYRRIITIAGSNVAGSFGGDGGLADSALLHGPNGVAIDKFGNVYIEDFFNFRVRKVNTAGYISTYAGNGNISYSGDFSTAASAGMWPNGVTCDSNGNVYISDNSNNCIRKVNGATGIITLFAGSRMIGYLGDTGIGGLAVNAYFNDPRGMCWDRKGNFYVADVGNHVIRRIDTGFRIHAFAGNNFPFYGGDGGYAINASLDSPMDVAADKYGNIYIADYKNNVIRKVDTNRVITTLAGTTAPGYSGDGGPAVFAQLNGPKGIAVDKNRFVYIADAFNNVIRMVDTLGNITTIAGNHTPGYGGDGGAPLGANLYFPQGVAVDTALSIFIADAENQRVRKIYTTTTGLKNIYSNSNLNVYPNPCNTEINVAGLKRGDNVMMADITGRIIGNSYIVQDEAVQTYPLSDIVAGIYMLQISDANGIRKAVVKVIKD